MNVTIGLVGCGRWGRHILRDLRSLGCQVATVARSAPSRARAVEGGSACVVATVEDLPDVDGIVVASPTATHAEVVGEVLGRGVPVFVEKPLTCDSASASRLAEAAGHRLFVMDKWRYHPGIEAMAAIARSGELGPVVGLRTTRVQWGSSHTDVSAIWILAPHDLSIALEVLGHVPAARSAVVDRRAGEAVGITAVLGDDPWMVMEAGSGDDRSLREISLRCEGGHVVLRDGWSSELSVWRHDRGMDVVAPEPERRPFPADLPLKRELEAFVAHLGGGPPPKTGSVEGAVIVRRVEELLALAGAGPGASSAAGGGPAA